MAENEVPQSNALAEATTDSLTELMSRDPEGYSRQDLGRIVQAMREMRVKWEAGQVQAQAEAGAKRRASPKASQLSTKAKVNSDELGL